MIAPSPPLISRLHVGILGLQPRDKAAMLGQYNRIVFSKDLNGNGGYFPENRNGFVLDHQHGRCDVTCKPAVYTLLKSLDAILNF